MAARVRWLALIAVLALITSACDWTMLGFNGGRTGFSAFETTVTPASVSKLTELWHTNAGAGVRAPVVSGGRVFTLADGSGHGDLRAYDAATGGCSASGACTPLWTAAPSKWFSGPIVAGGKVYASGAVSTVVIYNGGPIHTIDHGGGGYDLATGAASGGGSDAGNVVVANGAFYAWQLDEVTYGPGNTYYYWDLLRQSLDGSATTVLFEGDANLGDAYPPPSFSVANGSVYLGGYGGVFPDQPTRCSIQQRLPCPVSWTPAPTHTISLDSLPTIDKGLLYEAEIAGGVEVFDADGCGGADTCAPLWRAHAGDQHVGAVAIDDQTLFVGSDDGHLYAFPKGGCGHAVCEPTWSSAVGSGVHLPSVAGDLVFVGAQDGRVRAYDARGCGAATCASRWTSGSTGAPIRNAPVIAGGRVFTVNDSGTLSVFGLPN